MLSFAFTSILMVSLSTVLYLMVRALPRVADEPAGDGHGLLDRWGSSQFPERIDRAMNGFLLKFLRKLKVLVLKFDNSLSTHLAKVKPEEESKRPAIDFKEIAHRESGNGMSGGTGGTDAANEIKI